MVEAQTFEAASNGRSPPYPVVDPPDLYSAVVINLFAANASTVTMAIRCFFVFDLGQGEPQDTVIVL